ncbi:MULTISPECIES: acyl-CoA dehydrogenase family protein [unclassified Beijerinckia]|uniref:acyl-CoA dehydrogenase family protein n=1 Tax=unclassified Beijerinckia TaxID=2638183 RepID=UPI000894BC9E|nr:MULTISPECIES: acyl-CoA dehydrogenase family protein [unclassified Beijerinckia]MDH7799171.1 acyl-CoA dehydrogenase [Beijerinckia sp. GAS462]SED93027.1 acyl-CoA dehydrogenase [Beijerinckia sp. 28-YEA-48]
MRVETEELRIFQDHVRRFVEREISPFHRQWEQQGIVPRDLWLAAGRAGILCCTVSEEFGGAGADYAASAIVTHELGRAGATGPGFIIHSEMAAPYIQKHGSAAQKQRWLPDLVAGKAIAGVAMTEPSAGSDLRGIKTRARPTADGYALSGQKVFISNGQLADVLIVAAKVEGSGRLSLFLVDTTLPGFKRGKNLEKIGCHAQDTSEIFFGDVPLGEADLLGGLGGGFDLLKEGLIRERLTVCISSQARAEACLATTADYAKQRELFGQNLLSFQNTRFKLAEVKADLLAGRALVDRLLASYLADDIDGVDAAAGKLWVTEMLGRTADTCLQIHGGWGYMLDFPIARAFVDARVDRIAGGSSEVMKEIIARAI